MITIRIVMCQVFGEVHWWKKPPDNVDFQRLGKILDNIVAIIYILYICGKQWLSISELTSVLPIVWVPTAKYVMNNGHYNMFTKDFKRFGLRGFELVQVIIAVWSPEMTLWSIVARRYYTHDIVIVITWTVWNPRWSV